MLAVGQKDEDRIIGRGGYGTVYLGILRHTEVAVKFLSPVSLINKHINRALLKRVNIYTL